MDIEEIRSELSDAVALIHKTKETPSEYQLSIINNHILLDRLRTDQVQCSSKLKH